MLDARARLSTDDRTTAIDLARKAVAVAERCGDPTAAAEARVTLGQMQLFVDFDTGQETLDRVIREGRTDDRPQTVARALNALGHISGWLGRPDLADTYIALTLEHSEEHNLDLWRIECPRPQRDHRARSGTLD